MATVLRAWRKVPGRRGYKVGVAMVVFATAFKAYAIMAGLFSSLVTNTDSMVLMHDNHCGWPDHPHNEDDLVANSALYIPGVRIYENARAYAQKCYASTAGPNGASYDTFVKPALERTIHRDVDYPFGDGICESRGITVTSGYIDTHKDLGINTRPEDRIRFRKTLSCAVLDTENQKYNSGWVRRPPELQGVSNPLYDSPGVEFKIYRLGHQIIQNKEAPYSFYFSNTSTPRSGYQTQ